MHTVVIGGGFAGIKTALELSRQQSGRVTLISNRPSFFHHGAVSAAITGGDIAQMAISLDDIFATHSDVKVVHATLTSIDPDRKLAVCGHASYQYDTLVMALGSESDYSGIAGSHEHMFGARNIEQVRRFHDHLHATLVEDHHVERSYVIVGGGETGVELAGALRSYADELAKAHITRRAKVHITLVEAQSRLVPRHSHQASYHVAKRLKALGVDVLLNTRVERVDDEFVTIDKRKLPTETVLWAAGVRNNPFYLKHPQYFEVLSDGRVSVNPYLEAYRDIYVIGDNIDVKDAGRARSALDMAVYIADHLVRNVASRPLYPYRPSASLICIPIGAHWAYAECLGIYVTGKLGSYAHRRAVMRSYLQIMPRAMADMAVASQTTKTRNL